MLCEKVVELNKKLGGDKSLVATHGWLHKFKYRHRIPELDLQGKKMSANVDTANYFEDDFKKKLNKNNYDLGFVYNANETELNWK